MAVVVTNAGLAAIAGKFTGENTSTFNKIGWGTGAGTAAKADTTLFTEAAEARVTATLSRVTTAVANDTFQAVGTMTSGSTQGITNAGLLDSASGGILLIHGDHAQVPTYQGDTIRYTFQMQPQ